MPEWHITFVSRNEKLGADISDVRGTVIPAAHLDELGFDGFPESGVDYGILIDGDTDGEHRVVTAEEKEAAPVLVAVLYDGAFGPEVHGLKSLKGLRMASEITQYMWPHGGDYVEERVGNGDYAARGGSIPDIVSEE